jgi:hypothetical protein
LEKRNWRDDRYEPFSAAWRAFTPEKGGQCMRSSSCDLIGAAAAVSLAMMVGCTSVQESPKPAAQAAAQQKAPAKQEQAKTEESKPDQAKSTKQAAKKAVEVEGVISSVGQRTITFQVERKGKVREEVVGVDEKTNIEKGGSKVKLRDLQEADKALINYEPEAYTPATAIKVTGKGQIQKVGGDD